MFINFDRSVSEVRANLTGRPHTPEWPKWM